MIRHLQDVPGLPPGIVGKRVKKTRKLPNGRILVYLDSGFKGMSKKLQLTEEVYKAAVVYSKSDEDEGRKS